MPFALWTKSKLQLFRHLDFYGLLHDEAPGFEELQLATTTIISCGECVDLVTTHVRVKLFL